MLVLNVHVLQQVVGADAGNIGSWSVKGYRQQSSPSLCTYHQEPPGVWPITKLVLQSSQGSLYTVTSSFRMEKEDSYSSVYQLEPDKAELKPHF